MAPKTRLQVPTDGRRLVELQFGVPSFDTQYDTKTQVTAALKVEDEFAFAILWSGFCSVSQYSSKILVKTAALDFKGL